MAKGVYQGQPEFNSGFDNSTNFMLSTSGARLTDRLKGVYKALPDSEMFSILQPTEQAVASTPALSRSQSQLQSQPQSHSGEDLDSLAMSTRQPTRDSSPCRQGKQSTYEVSSSSNKTIKITFEDTATSVTTTETPDPHPQEKLDQFWNVFEPQYLGKITRILPTSLIESTPATSKSAGDKSHCSSQSYAQAKERCIRDVKRIVRECRANNKKYTDTHFDIERDLKITKRRDCLDGLYNTTTSGAGEGISAAPTDVKRVTEIFENPIFFGEGAGEDDIIQGTLGDCWLLAAFSILTCNSSLVKDICVIQDAEVGVYGFVFYRDGDWHQCIIDDKLYLRAPSYDESGDVVLGMYGVQQRDQERSYNDLFQKGSKSLYFAQCRNENETWVPLLEKAMAKAHGCYGALVGGQTGEAIEDLTGGVTQEIYTNNLLNKDKFWYDELRKIGKDFVFSAAAATYREWRAPQSSSVRVERRQGIVSGHAYAVLDTYEGHGERLVKMRNPWGNSEWTGPWSDGSKEWNAEWFERLNHKFGDDGVFWISYEDMLRKYKYLDRTRIFSSEWHVAQQWVNVQVPWNTTDYQQTRFQIDVPSDTDAVIVLSQLDDRYFQGFQGKFNYTVQFRIHKDSEGGDEQDDEEDYIARSAHTYELVRSNNVELSLEKGKYTVLFKVEAKKTDRKDIEDVIRANIWRKEKLMQTGTLYDLAHQKGQSSHATSSKRSSETQESEEEKANKKTKKEINEKDPNRDPWNAACVVGLRVYSKNVKTGLKIVTPGDDEEPNPPVLDRDDIAKAPLDEAQQNSQMTPEGSEAGEETATAQETATTEESAATEVSTTADATTNTEVSATTEETTQTTTADSEAVVATTSDTQPDQELKTTEEKSPDESSAPAVSEEGENPPEQPKTDEMEVDTANTSEEVDVVSASIMDDLSGDKNCMRGMQ